jgi:hypothetical protein
MCRVARAVALPRDEEQRSPRPRATTHTSFFFHSLSLSLIPACAFHSLQRSDISSFPLSLSLSLPSTLSIRSAGRPTGSRARPAPPTAIRVDRLSSDFRSGGVTADIIVSSVVNPSTYT